MINFGETYRLEVKYPGYNQCLEALEVIEAKAKILFEEGRKHENARKLIRASHLTKQIQTQLHKSQAFQQYIEEKEMREVAVEAGGTYSVEDSCLKTKKQLEEYKAAVNLKLNELTNDISRSNSKLDREKQLREQEKEDHRLLTKELTDKLSASESKYTDLKNKYTEYKKELKKYVSIFGDLNEDFCKEYILMAFQDYDDFEQPEDLTLRMDDRKSKSLVQDYAKHEVQLPDIEDLTIIMPNISSNKDAMLNFIKHSLPKQIENLEIHIEKEDDIELWHEFNTSLLSKYGLVKSSVELNGFNFCSKDSLKEVLQKCAHLHELTLTDLQLKLDEPFTLPDQVKCSLNKLNLKTTEAEKCWHTDKKILSNLLQSINSSQLMQSLQHISITCVG